MSVYSCCLPQHVNSFYVWFQQLVQRVYPDGRFMIPLFTQGYLRCYEVYVAEAAPTLRLIVCTYAGQLRRYELKIEGLRVLQLEVKPVRYSQLHLTLQGFEPADLPPCRLLQAFYSVYQARLSLTSEARPTSRLDCAGGLFADLEEEASRHMFIIARAAAPLQEVTVAQGPLVAERIASPREREIRQPWESTLEKLEALRKLRQSSNTGRYVTINRVSACQQVGIDPKTVKEHDPELWERWSDCLF